MLLIDLPLCILQLIVLEVEAAGVYEDLTSICLSHNQFYRFLTGCPALTIKFKPVIVQHVDAIHDVLIQRCDKVIGGLWLYRTAYLCFDFQLWFQHHVNEVGITGISELVFRLLRFEFVELLCGSNPPTHDQLLELQEIETGSFYAVYMCLVNAMSTIESVNKQAIFDLLLHLGSCTDQTNGFRARRSHYNNRYGHNLPAFMVAMNQKGIEYDLFALIPILRVDFSEKIDLEFGDMRVPVVFIETIMMMWLRSLLPGSAWEKLMAYSPWAVDTSEFVRTNRVVSTKLEYPAKWPKTPAQQAQQKRITAEKRKATWEALSEEAQEEFREEKGRKWKEQGGVEKQNAKRAAWTPEQREEENRKANNRKKANRERKMAAA